MYCAINRIEETSVILAVDGSRGSDFQTLNMK